MDLLFELVHAMRPESNAVWREDCEELDQLVQQGCLIERGGDQYVITRRAMEMLMPAQTYKQPVPIMNYRPDNPPDPSNEPPMMLLLLLLDNGWQEVCVQKTRKCSPYTPGANKHIYYHLGGGLTRFYLLAMLESEKLFKKGVHEIHYFQLEEYYKFLINCSTSQVDMVKPNLKAVEQLVLLCRPRPKPKSKPSQPIHIFGDSQVYSLLVSTWVTARAHLLY